ncbi:MAG: ATPase, T2SS/T4P/T4SS family [Verrucomicrobiae bacterium]|nr:ATPase, T2SS/T4P/T4SS family [Verrucomicrobiae bacterium]
MSSPASPINPVMLRRYLNDRSLTPFISDLRLQNGSPPFVNMNRQWMPHPSLRDSLTEAEMSRFLAEAMQVDSEGDLRKARPDSLDFSFDATVGEQLYRFRGHESENYMGFAVDVRVLRAQIDPLDGLGFPKGLAAALLEKREGIIVVGGPTGSGKSTTMASLVREFCQIYPGSHVVSLEDPVEYVFRFRDCMFSQKHVGTHVQTWEEGIFRAKREKPDLIVIGEMRTPETIRLAVEAAGSGHLVITTTFADRVSRVFDAVMDAHSFQNSEGCRVLRHKLGGLVRGVICQMLVRREAQDGEYVLPELMYEALVNDQQAIRSAIVNGSWARLDAECLAGSRSVSWQKRLGQLLEGSLISPSTAEMLRCKFDDDSAVRMV